MRTLHIHNLFEHVHRPHWHQIEQSLRKMVCSPIFWAIVAMALLLAMMVLLAVFGNPNAIPNPPYHLGPVYPFYYPFTM